MSGERSFLITIDTEGDDIWSRPRTITTRNAEFLPRFQALCDRYSMKPTYLTNYEMAICPAFQDLARDALRRGACEIGMHLHAWNSPPLEQLTEDDYRHHPYLVDYPDRVMREKALVMTRLLEDIFGAPVKSHRAGRWNLDSRYAKILMELGYVVDCSVTPYVSWKETPGAPDGKGGADYSTFPDDAYVMDLETLSRPGNSPLLELPMTIVSSDPAVVRRIKGWLPLRSLARRGLDRVFPPPVWLRPNGRNIEQLLALVERKAASGAGYVQFMLHSSEFMPGGSPTFPDARSIDALHSDLERLFEAGRTAFPGRTLMQHRALLQA